MMLTIAGHELAGTPCPQGMVIDIRPHGTFTLRSDRESWGDIHLLPGDTLQLTVDPTSDGVGQEIHHRIRLPNVLTLLEKLAWNTGFHAGSVQGEIGDDLAWESHGKETAARLLLDGEDEAVRRVWMKAWALGVVDGSGTRHQYADRGGWHYRLSPCYRCGSSVRVDPGYLEWCLECGWERHLEAAEAQPDEC
jgi:hypothetical protein